MCVLSEVVCCFCNHVFVWQVVVWWVDHLMVVCAKSSKLGSGESYHFFKRCVNVQYFCLPSVTCLPASLQHLVNLFARLANDNIGYIDWDPYIPKVCCFLVFPLHTTQFSTCLFWVLRHKFSCVARPLWFGLLVRETNYHVSLLLSVPQRKWLASCLCFNRVNVLILLFDNTSTSYW